MFTSSPSPIDIISWFFKPYILIDVLVVVSFNCRADRPTPSNLPPTLARGLYQATPTPRAASTGQMTVLQQSFYLPHSQPFPTTPSIKTRSNSFINRPQRQSPPITNMVDDKPSNIRPIHPYLQIPPLHTISPRQQDSEAALDQLNSVRSDCSALSNSSHGLSYSPTQTSDFVSSTLSRMSYHSFSGSESPTSFFSSFGTSPHSSLMSSSSLPSSSLAPFTPPPQTMKRPSASRLIIPSLNLDASRLHHTQEQHSRSLEDGVGQELFQALFDGTLSPIGADWMQLDTDNSLHIAQVLQYLAVKDSINQRNDSFSLSNEEDTPPNSDTAKKPPGNVPLPVPIHPSQFIREPNSSTSTGRTSSIDALSLDRLLEGRREQQSETDWGLRRYLEGNRPHVTSFNSSPSPLAKSASIIKHPNRRHLHTHGLPLAHPSFLFRIHITLHTPRSSSSEHAESSNSDHTCITSTQIVLPSHGFTKRHGYSRSQSDLQPVYDEHISPTSHIPSELPRPETERETARHTEKPSHDGYRIGCVSRPSLPADGWAMETANGDEADWAECHFCGRFVALEGGL
ncbi:hypothetical protein BLNAU_20616 [Blattamonas nauphoetae]|uniref:Uncharacterized protein n=1 Tax=Blattamonas nauphoetae TaxID=2049346 RepID=A0ABQ9WY72_9EUKA|nr:hypothetical protein BLNAU_20616 [Blattamonas nauphoetae]